MFHTTRFVCTCVLALSLLPLRTPAQDMLARFDRDLALRQFEEVVYGPPPPAELSLSATPTEEPQPVFDSLGYRYQVRLRLENAAGDYRAVDVLVYYPLRATNGPVPTALNLNFKGNRGLVGEEAKVSEESFYVDYAVEAGERRRRLPVELILQHGFAVITAGYHDFLPDEDGYAHAVMTDFYGMDSTRAGAISVWAYAYSLLADYAREQDRFAVDSLVAVGHSRLGKAVLLAAARDERLRAVHVNDSGSGGAALFSRMEGETIADLVDRFPHWFRDDFAQYAGRDSLLPFDQDRLIAAVAPRRVMISSASEDGWADPEGEFLSLRAALAEFRRYDVMTLLPPDFPEPSDGQPRGTGLVAYHLRAGKHDLLAADWEAFLRFLQGD